MSQDDGIDEVALNVLLAQGVDFPTALEASRIPDSDRDGDPAPTSNKPASRAVEIIAIVLAMLVVLLVWGLF